MEWLNRYIARLAARWPFRAIVIGIPIVCGVFFVELSLTIDLSRRREFLAAIIDLVPALAALTLAAVFFFALPIRARCEGRPLPWMAKVMMAATAIFSAWMGGSVAEIFTVSQRQHNPMRFEETFEIISSVAAIAVNGFAVLVLTRETFKRCKVLTAEQAEAARAAKSRDSASIAEADPMS